MKHYSRSLLASLCIFSAVIPLTQALAEATTPFYTVNQNPFIQAHGLPPLEKGRVTAVNTTTSWTVLDIASASITESAPQESIILDGETYRLNFMFRHGLKKNAEIGIDIPYITHSGGTLDGFIRNWHDTFGLTNSERNQFQVNQLHYEYSRDGVTQSRMVDTTDGIGDIRLSAAWQLRCDHSPQQRCSALRASLKLPTGKAEKLTGSGGVDLSLALTNSNTYQRFTLNYGGGLLLNGHSDLLNDRQKLAVGFANLGLNYQPQRFSWMVLKAQLDGHSAFYDSALKNLSSDSLQINVGGTILFSDKTALDIGVVEDIVTSTVPDVVFHLALRLQHQKSR